MKKTSLVMLVLASMAVGASARADALPHKAAQVSMEVPKGWKTQGDENNMVILEPKEEVLLVLRVLDGGELQKALEAADAFISKQVEKPVWGAKKEAKLNGMDAMSRKGSGAYQGKPVDLGLLIVSTPAKKYLLVLGIMDHTTADAHKAEMNGFLNSIKPLK